MADYDSDSSGDDNSDVHTNVLLGYASVDPTGDDFSQLGGLPKWLDEKATPSGTFSKCKVCNGTMSLLLQLNGDLPERFPGHERRLYVFGCRRKACRRKEGCVRALRGGRVDKSVKAESSLSTKAKEPLDTTPQQPKHANLGETIFGVGPSKAAQSNPFALGSVSTSNPSGMPLNPFATRKVEQREAAKVEPAAMASTADSLPATFAQKAKLSPSSEGSQVLESPRAAAAWEPWPEDRSPYPRFNLDADTEYLDSDTAMKDVPSNARLDNSAENEGSASEDKAAFESTLDKTFQRFADRLAQNPEQVLRYEYGGDPLLYSKTDPVGKIFSTSSSEPNRDAKVRVISQTLGGSSRLPRCTNCGATRTFELQLTPHAITELEVEEPGLDGMDWGTIIVGACTTDCQGAEAGTVGYVEEWVGVQWEEMG